MSIYCYLLLIYLLRAKRILYGWYAEQQHRDFYPSFRYFTFLARSPYISNFEDAVERISPLPENLVCGGALLTPNVVQTACHCIANFIVDPDEDENKTFAQPLNVWEDRIYSCYGQAQTVEMYEWLIPKHYITYTACRRLEGLAQFVMFDYGLIITKDKVNEKSPHAMISYAPAYRARDLQKFYYNTIQKEYTCLFIGHGGWQTMVDDNGYYVEVDEPSDFVRWGWRPTMNYVDCLSVTYSPLKRDLFYYNYTGESTWVCHQGQYEHDITFNIFKGDSGGPVICNGVYFAVNSFSSSVYSLDVISYTSPIVHTHFENAVEFRTNFHTWCDNRASDIPDDAEPHPEDPRASVTPPPIDQRSTAPRSTSNILSHFLVLSYSVTAFYFL
ncbi:hypothetical protein GE061_018392 [Apolygus lucorum]|uniref:Peptidase S1 domain-containing protein n=1 Tax=Apolygus lucorum TaxID=248454 RepID=A0A8S9XDW9_APOLU|nr:hypothetical protein GE061_018392 [Apolygus lucorum]